MTPVIALDFASLYPSIIRAHNLSPETVIPLFRETYYYTEKQTAIDGTERVTNKCKYIREEDQNENERRIQTFGD